MKLKTIHFAAIAAFTFASTANAATVIYLDNFNDQQGIDKGGSYT
jgi:hypothetical protein